MIYTRNTNVEQFLLFGSFAHVDRELFGGKKCRLVVKKTYPSGYSQCQSDKPIDRPSIWEMRYDDADDFNRYALLSQEPTELGQRREVPCDILANKRLLRA
ncbi:hypothetical protein TNCV_1704281 [Trichonephila clavipes]|nr:hypothetical protein TNCV_1704281 [Trichonephila clavipes]